MLELGCGLHSGSAHDVFRESLRALDARGAPARPEDGDAGPPQLVGDAGDERGLGPDDHEVDRPLAAEGE